LLIYNGKKTVLFVGSGVK